jgi:hypothetical protein
MIEFPKPNSICMIEAFIKRLLLNRKYVLKIVTNEIKYLPPVGNFNGGIEYLKSANRFNRNI